MNTQGIETQTTLARRMLRHCAAMVEAEETARRAAEVAQLIRRRGRRPLLQLLPDDIAFCESYYRLAVKEARRCKRLFDQYLDATGSISLALQRLRKNLRRSKSRMAHKQPWSILEPALRSRSSLPRAAARIVARHVKNPLKRKSLESKLFNAKLS